MEASTPPTTPALNDSRADNPRSGKRWRGWAWFLAVLLVVSVCVNLVLWGRYDEYYAGSEPPEERFYDGNRTAEAKIARITVAGTIMPPFTGRILKSLKRAEEDPAVRGVLLIVDSPGGLVADSHEIYHRLKSLRAKKPVVVSMRRMAASGGLYVAMGAGPEGLIFAEPTTWTGSIGVIIPRYEFTELAEKLGVDPGSLKTGPMKDSLNPIRPLTEKEIEVWNAILTDSFDRFINVIDENRTQLDEAKIRELATGQIYTADQALDVGLVDRIGFEEDALAALLEQLELTDPRVIEYEFPGGLLDLLMPAAKAANPQSRLRNALDQSGPSAFYHCGGPTLSADWILHQFP